MSIKLTEQQQQDLLAYVEGTLSADAAARVEVFLANTDPQLAAQIADMIDQRHAVAALPKLKAPGDMAQRIMEQVERESLLDDRHQYLDARPWWQSRWLMAASVLMVVSVFGYYVIHAAMKNSDTMDKWQVAKQKVVITEQPLAVNELPPTPTATPAPAQGAQQVGQQIPIQANDNRVLADAATTPNENLQRQALARNDANYPQLQTIPMNPAPNAPMPQQLAARGEIQRVYIAPEHAPILVTLAARDPSDSERLRMLLLSMATGSTTMKSASSAPARAFAAEALAESKTASAGVARPANELLQARLTPESFRRVASQFAVVNIVPAHEARQRNTNVNVKETALSGEQDALAGAAPMTGEADYIFRFVKLADTAKPAAASESKVMAAPAAPAARPASTQPATQAHP